MVRKKAKNAVVKKKKTAKPAVAAKNTKNFVPSSSESSNSPFTNLVYNKSWGKEHNNCYAYAIDHFSPSTDEKLQPGDLSSPPNKKDLSLKKCGSLEARAAADLGSRAYKISGSADTTCKAGYYKIFPVIAPGKDYHWYRSNKDVVYRVDAKDPKTVTSLAKQMGVKKSQFLSPEGSKLSEGQLIFVKNANLWSHKRGFATGPLLKDACGKFIKDPQTACRNYGEYNYKVACNAFCVKKKS